MHALHAWAVLPALVGLCCLAADRRARAVEAAASLLMLVAMLDGAFGPAVPAVAWSGMLVAGALALVLTARGRAGGHIALPGMTAVNAVGMIVMAALVAAMPAATAIAAGASDGAAGFAAAHAHAPAAFTAVILTGSAGYALVATVAAGRARRILDRAQYATMAAATVLMAAALV